MSTHTQAYLVLEDGTIIEGKSFGAEGVARGEVVFNTAMTGYQEALSDPSYCGQIVTLTYPLIGNYGINRDDFESITPSVEGLIVKEHSTYPSNWRAEKTIHELLTELNIPGLYDIDTRQLTRKIRDSGTLKGKIITEHDLIDRSLDQHIDDIGEYTLPNDQVQQVSTKNPFHCPGKSHRVVLIDYGLKSGILGELTKRGCDIRVVPYDVSAQEIRRLRPDGVLLSNGPGDPQSVAVSIRTIRDIIGQFPIFGVCLGHQLLAIACGAHTERLRFGHRGTNYPVLDIENNRTLLTSQNHGYTVRPDSIATTPLKITHTSINDGTVEGLRHQEFPVFSVQFHPEARPGPIDSNDLFDQFIDSMSAYESKGGWSHVQRDVHR